MRKERKSQPDPPSLDRQNRSTTVRKKTAARKKDNEIKKKDAIPSIAVVGEEGGGFPRRGCGR